MGNSILNDTRILQAVSEAAKLLVSLKSTYPGDIDVEALLQRQIDKINRELTALEILAGAASTGSGKTPTAPKAKVKAKATAE